MNLLAMEVRMMGLGDVLFTYSISVIVIVIVIVIMIHCTYLVLTQSLGCAAPSDPIICHLTLEIIDTNIYANM